MTHLEIRKKFLEFFEKKGHKIVPSSSLLPDDPSVLFTTAGMQQFKPYLTGELDPTKTFGSRDVFTIQKCFRTTDIDEVGDDSHNTFFEMVGNFSFGNYFKEQAIKLSFELLTSSEYLHLDPQRIYTTAFAGDTDVPRDEEAIHVWQDCFSSVGIDAKIGERIFLYGREKNWWETGLGPAGPDAEMFYDRGLPHNPKFGQACHPNCDCGKFVEIGNDVFIQYNQNKKGHYEPLKQKSIDNGRGFERLVMILQNKNSVFETDLFEPLIRMLPSKIDARAKRIVADHARAIAFLITDGVRPSNKEQGYVLRRLIRRIIIYGHTAKLDLTLMHDVFAKIHEIYSPIYPNLDRNLIIHEFDHEKEKFEKTLRQGLKELEKLSQVDAPSAFKLYESYGLPYEVIKEIGAEKAQQLNRELFDAEFKKHQELSRAGQEKKFGGHGLLLDTGELKAANEEELKKVTRLHTATHMLQAALRKVLGNEVQQAGSDITAERLRFDFTFPRKVTSEELEKVEDVVNNAVKQDLPVSYEEMPIDQALKSGALFFFFTKGGSASGGKEKYPAVVKVYTVGTKSNVFSRELCGGPHVTHTDEIGNFKITKEEAVGAGVRRIRAIVTWV